jgi:hypothetical protein
MMLPENPLTGYAESSIDLEFDMLHDSDCCDFEYGDPAEWAEWTDEFRWDLGPDDAPYEPAAPYLPTVEDWNDYLDYLERVETERSFGVNMRFAP